MILSVSRRTDIPAFYSEWFMNRIKEGFVYVRNPFNPNQISKIPITTENIDCIVFWSKNPKPMLKYLDEINSRGFKYYFQFTITPYNNKIECNIDDKKDIIRTFINISKKIGRERIILRYDPILLTEKYNVNYHLKAFEMLLDELGRYTNRVVISFIDNYKKIATNMKTIEAQKFNETSIRSIAKGFSEVAQNHSLKIETCAEKIDLSEFGINHSSCIDTKLIEKIIGCHMQMGRNDKQKLDGNREACGCVKCIDIGEYNTCIHNCTYCYANINKYQALANYKKHNKDSPILIGNVDGVVVKERNPKDTKSFKAKKILEDYFQEKLF